MLKKTFEKEKESGITLLILYQFITCVKLKSVASKCNGWPVWPIPLVFEKKFMFASLEKSTENSH